MSISISPGLASTMTAQLVTQFNGGFVDIYSGLQPASSDLAPTGTLLGTVSVDGLPGAGLHFVASGNTMTKALEPWVVKPVVDGTAGWFRLRQAGDAGDTSLTALRIDGSIGLSSDPQEMVWDTLTMVTGQAFTIDDFTYSITPV